MATNKPRLIVTLEPKLHQKVKRLAGENRISLSQAAHDLIQEASEDVEEWGLVRLAKERLKNLEEGKLLTRRQFREKAGG